MKTSHNNLQTHPFTASEDGALMGHTDNNNAITYLYVNGHLVYWMSQFETNIILPLKKGDIVSASRNFEVRNDLIFFPFLK